MVNEISSKIGSDAESERTARVDDEVDSTDNDYKPSESESLVEVTDASESQSRRVEDKSEVTSDNMGNLDPVQDESELDVTGAVPILEIAEGEDFVPTEVSRAWPSSNKCDRSAPEDNPALEGCSCGEEHKSSDLDIPDLDDDATWKLPEIQDIFIGGEEVKEKVLFFLHTAVVVSAASFILSWG
jgi:hypothetical protein